MNSIGILEHNFENKTNDATEAEQENDEFVVMVDDFVNFPQTTVTSEQTDYEERFQIAPVNFPSNITAIKLLPQTDSLGRSQ